MARDKDVYFAKLAEQSERYDEMADYMEAVGKLGDELSVEEQHAELSCLQECCRLVNLKFKL